MEKSTTKEHQSSKKVVVECGPIIRKIRIINPPHYTYFYKRRFILQTLNKYGR
ncbi:4c [Turkey coronavirus]|uniref:4c n=1 Tax=Turkey enteric coronavirus TaxID=11152 RepID=B3TD67_CVTKE|nr:4c [Turkey coronavirus]